MAFTKNDLKLALQNAAEGKTVQATTSLSNKAWGKTKSAAGFVAGTLPVTTRRFNAEMEDAHKRDVINAFLISDLIEQLQDLGLDVGADSVENLDARAEAFLASQVEAKKEEVKAKKEEKKAEVPASLMAKLKALISEEGVEEPVKKETAPTPKEEETKPEPKKPARPKKEVKKEESKKEEVKAEETKKSGRRRLGRQAPIDVDGDVKVEA